MGGRARGSGKGRLRTSLLEQGSHTLVVTAVTAGVGKSAPSSPSTKCEVTNEMDTGTAGGMTWLPSHCPLLGWVIPSSADVSTGAKGRTERKEKEPTVTFPFPQGRAFCSHETPCPRDGPGARGPVH